MLTIKRYPNRKLYDTAAKQYVSLERIADKIREGGEIQVLDHVTGEDLTALVLTQIIVEQEKQHSGSLPLTVLTGLVQAGENTLAALRRTFAAPLSLMHQVDDEITRRVEGLIKRGELAEEDGQWLAARLRELSPDDSFAAFLAPDEIARRLAARGCPSRAQIQALSDLVDALSAEVAAYGQKSQALTQDSGMTPPTASGTHSRTIAT